LKAVLTLRWTHGESSSGGPTRPATFEQGITLGTIFLVAGLGFLLLGVFLGRLVS
jgi:hypothetical protein